MKIQFKQRWNDFFFSNVDPRVYAYLRLTIGGILAIYAMVLGPNWLFWFSENGVMDQAALQKSIDPDTWSILNCLPGTPAVLWTIYAVICIQIGMLLVGFKTQFQSLCLFIWFLSLHHRNNLIWEGGDILLRVTLFLMIFMPLGALWSVDARLRKEKKECSVWPLRLLQIQLSLLYFSSVGQKLRGQDWLNGSAVYYSSQLDDAFGRLFSFHFPIEYFWVYQTMTWLILAVEILLIWGLWVPSLRRSVVCIGVLLHLALELSMNLFVFQWLMIIILLTFLFKVETAPSSGLSPAGNSSKN